MENFTVKLLNQFQEVCQERIAKISEFLLNEKDSPNPDFGKIQNICRELHTLKGEARMLMIAEIADIVHILEEKFHEVQRKEQWTTSSDLFLESLDIILEIIDSKIQNKDINNEKIQNIKRKLQEDINRNNSDNLGLEKTPEDSAITHELVMEFCRMYPTRLGRINTLLASMKDTLVPDHKKLQSVLSEVIALKGDTKILGIHTASEHLQSLADKIQQVQRHKMWEISVDKLVEKLNSMESLLQKELQSKYSDKKKLESIGVTKKYTKVEHITTRNPAIKAEEEKARTEEGAENDITKVVKDNAEEIFAEESQSVSALREIFDDPLKTQRKLPAGHKFSESTIRTEKKITPTDKKNPVKGTLPIPIHKLEVFSFQIEKVTLLLNFLQNLIKSSQKNKKNFKEVYRSLQSFLNIHPESCPKDARQKISQFWNFQEKFYEQCTNLLFDLESSTEDLMNQNLSFRLVPLSFAGQYFQRGVYDIAKSMGKEVRLTTTGMETELDRTILENVMEISLHILRNAIGHGIEDPEKRQSSGKTRYGNLSIQAKAKGQEVEILISDDGQGIDPEKVVNKALEMGLEEMPRIKSLSEKEKIELIFLPGLTTNKEADQISGRGLGLDIVKNTIESIDGKIQVISEKGKGTSFVIRIPTTLTKLSILLIKVNELLVGIPHYFVEEVMYLKSVDIQTISGQKTISVQGKNIFLQSLHEKFGFTIPDQQYAQNNRIPVMVLKMQDGSYYAYIVDKFLGERQVIAKPFNCFLKKYRLFSAATLLDEGDLAYILNMGKMLQGTTKNPQIISLPMKKKILLVEDSPITREMEKIILETYNYEVMEAENGKVALEILGEYKPDLLISDVEMPEMDGLELTKRIRENKKYQFPIIIVSTKGSQQDILRGVEAGADAYILKGEFHKENFIETVKKWL